MYMLSKTNEKLKEFKNRFEPNRLCEIGNRKSLRLSSISCDLVRLKNRMCQIGFKPFLKT